MRPVVGVLWTDNANSSKGGLIHPQNRRGKIMIFPILADEPSTEIDSVLIVP